MWLYGSGFPKSHNIGKSVDKLEGNEREVVGKSTAGMKPGSFQAVDSALQEKPDITKGQSDWEGWGSALKPANEPICLARKPLSEKSIAENVLKWGTGGINVDGCRVRTTDTYNYKNGPKGNSFSVGKEPDGKRTEPVEMNSEGRFPANIILDEIAGEMLDEQSGISKSSPTPSHKRKGNVVADDRTSKAAGIFGDGNILYGSNHNDSGGASRFFFNAKVSKAERNMGLDEGIKSNHPTVKPVNLMSYLCRLITPPNGIVLDPFMGSGSTGISALLEGFRFCGMEMDSEYFKIAEARINSYEEYRKFIKKNV
jgi:site-specific DNA-methyltransferase (adenine-specific)